MQYLQKLHELDARRKGYASISKVISSTKSAADIESLEKWRRKVGNKVAERINEASKQRGRAVHFMMEQLNEQGKTGNKSIDKFLRNQGINNIWTEGCIYNDDEKYQGRLDMLAFVGDSLCIIDFKTSLKPKLERYMGDNLLQLSAYQKAFNKMYNENIDESIIIVARPKNEGDIPKLTPDNDPKKVVITPEDLLGVDFLFQMYWLSEANFKAQYSVFKKRVKRYYSSNSKTPKEKIKQQNIIF